MNALPHDAPRTFEAIAKARRTCRRFLSEPVSFSVVNEILTTAAQSPSGSNIQPWKVHVVAGGKLEELTSKMLEALARDPDGGSREYTYYPKAWREPFLSRRRATGWGLYGLLGIQKGDREATERQRAQNFAFFNAPVACILTLDEDVEIGSWLDLGMFAQTLMLAAASRGLATCPQVAIERFHAIIEEVLALPPTERVIFSIALGWPDPEAPENRLVTDRAPPSEFARFYGFCAD